MEDKPDRSSTRGPVPHASGAPFEALSPVRPTVSPNAIKLQIAASVCRHACVVIYGGGSTAAGIRWGDKAHGDEPGGSGGRAYCLLFVPVALMLSGAPAGLARVA